MKPTDDLPVKSEISKVDALITDAHPEKLRRSERAFLRIPIEVRGKTEAGDAFREQASTQLINRHGARISLKAAVRPEDRITVTNLQSGVCCPFRVVARIAKAFGERPEWGIECLQPDQNFWGISFPERVIERTPTPAAQESVDALLECAVCSAREFAHLTLEDYRQLCSSTQLERSCPQCGRATAWRFGFVEEEVEEWAPSAPAPAASPVEKRRSRRLAVKLPVKIRLQDGREDMARTEDLSKTGACLTSSLELKANDQIQMIVGYSEGTTTPEVAARVVWRREFEKGKPALYGVRMEEK